MGKTRLGGKHRMAVLGILMLSTATGAFGQDGVDKCLAILNSELKRTMQFAGATSIAQISRDSVFSDD